MGREVRMVPADWKHPKEFNQYRGCDVFKPLLDGFSESLSEWKEGKEQWDRGLIRDYINEGWKPKPSGADYETYEEWAGECPKKEDYMPDWHDDQRTHYMMYEDTSEGTPISPAFETPEDLARWLTDTGASSFGDSTATYEQWLRVAKGGYAPSAVLVGGKIISGVEF